MPDEIKQTLGLDATQALDALKNLDTGFKTFAATVNSVSSNLVAFNANAGKTVSALIQIESRANSAAAALNKLNSITPHANTAGPSPAANPTASLPNTQAAAALNNLLVQITQNATAAANAVNGLGQNTSNSLGPAANKAGGFAVSLETVVRVLSTQLIVRGLNAIRDAVEGSFQGFIKFNKAAAEIGTISGDKIDVIRQDVRKLSDEFNAPILDVAKAKYEVLSNGFVKAADEAQVLTAALKFSKVGIASVSESVDLISTSLNAYGNTADHAETISAKLFKTIELGRVVGSELANSFGRVAPVAKEIGASEDEILAAFSSITIGGVKASEAATQIRATLSSLLKPSADAQEAFRKLGVESGEELIRAKGFQGALQALIGTTDGSASAIAKLFPNVRALNGVLRETGTGVDIFQDHLKKIQASSADLLNKTFKIRVETNAEQVDRDINRLKNSFTADLGEALVNTAANVIRFTGGIDTTIGVIQAMVPVVGALVLGLTAYGVAAGIGALNTRLLGSSVATTSVAMQALNSSIVLLGLGIAGFQAASFLSDQLDKFATEHLKKIEEVGNQELAFNKSQLDAEFNLRKIASERNTQVTLDGFAKINAAAFKQADDAQIANKELVDNDKASLDKIIQARERFATDLRRSSQQAQQAVASSEKKANDVRGQLDDAQFSFRQRKFTQNQQAFRNQQRALQLSQNGATILSSANTKVDRSAADSAFQRAEAAAHEAISTAQTTGNRTAQFRAEQTLETVLKRRIDAEAAFQKNQQKDADELNKKAAEEEARVTRLKQLSQDFLKNISLTDEKGKALPEATVTANFAKSKDQLAAIIKDAFAGDKKFDAENLFTFDKLQARLDQAITKGELTDLKATPSALDKLLAQIQGSLKDTAFLVSLAPDPEKLKGLSPTEQRKGAQDQLGQSRDELDRQDAGLKARLAATQEVDQAQKKLNQTLSAEQTLGETTRQTFLQLTTGLVNAATGETEAFNQIFESVENTVKRVSKQADITKAQVDALINSAHILRSEAPDELKGESDRLEASIVNLVRIFQAQQSVKGQSKAGLTDTNLQSSQAVNRNAADQVRLRAILGAESGLQAQEQTTNSVASATRDVSSAMGGASDRAQKFADLMQRSAANAERVKAAVESTPSTGGTVGRALGGPIGHFSAGGLVRSLQFLASGGAARGTDSVAAMLTPGETVINAGSSQKFFSQLQAIQAGVAPSSPGQSGGNTTNISVGDINVNGSGAPKQTARAVMDAIRREQRRNTANINR